MSSSRYLRTCSQTPARQVSSKKLTAVLVLVREPQSCERSLSVVGDPHMVLVFQPTLSTLVLILASNVFCVVFCFSLSATWEWFWDIPLLSWLVFAVSSPLQGSHTARSMQWALLKAVKTVLNPWDKVKAIHSKIEQERGRSNAERLWCYLAIKNVTWITKQRECYCVKNSSSNN